jgi:hypothetical protein
MKPPKKNRLPSILGLCLGDGQLRASRAVRAKGGIEISQTAAAALALDLLHPESELVGREIKNPLDAAAIRERNCIVAVPPRWIMIQQTKVPEMAPEDAESFLQLEAEKCFPVDPAQLQITRSLQHSAAGNYITQLAVRREQIDQLSDALKSAGLKPVSFALGLAVLPGAIPPAGRGRITVAVEPAGVTLLAAAGGGIAALRTFDASIESEAGEHLVNAAAVARELRITFEQLPAELRAEIKQLVLVGDSGLARQLAEGLADWAGAAGLAIERGDLPEKTLAGEIAAALATRYLENGVTDFEFLPPHPSRWSRLVARYNSRRLASIGLAVGAAALLAVLAFGWQEIRLLSLRSDWSAMASDVTQLDAVQGRIREFRPFYDTSFRTLTILKRVTECFPDNGAVTAKTFEIHNNAIISISGTARDNASLLRMQDQLRKAREVTGLKIEQIRGKTPAQFTLTFRWDPNAGS